MTPDPLTPSPDSPTPQNPQGEKPDELRWNTMHIKCDHSLSDDDSDELVVHAFEDGKTLVEIYQGPELGELHTQTMLDGSATNLLRQILTPEEIGTAIRKLLREQGWNFVVSHDNPLTNSAVPDCWIHDEYEVAWSEEEALRKQLAIPATPSADERNLTPEERADLDAFTWKELKGNQNEETATPRTDSETLYHIDSRIPVVNANFARQLERELTSLQSAREKEREDFVSSAVAREKKADEDRDACESLIEELKGQLAAARTHCKLRSAGHDDLRTRLNQLNANLNQLRATLAERDRELLHKGEMNRALEEEQDRDRNELNDLRAQLAELREAHGGAVYAQHKAVERAEEAECKLAETHEKLKEAEHDLKRTRESDATHEALWKQGATERVALEAHIEKLREALETCRVVQLDDVSATYHFDPTLVSDALCSRPELPQSAQ